MMSIFQWFDQRLQILRWYDLALIKLSVAAFMLLVVQIWPQLLQVDWRLYALIFVVAMIMPLYRFYFKRI